MVWDNWNHLKDIRDEWRDSSNVWGKIKVFLFYTYVWIMFFARAYNVFVPWSQFNSCFIAKSTENQGALTFMIRQYNIVVVAWSLYVLKAKTTLPNLRAFFAVLLVACIVAHIKEGQRIFEGPCGDYPMAKWYYWLGWPFVTLVCAYLERFVERRTSTAAETQALV